MKEGKLTERSKCLKASRQMQESLGSVWGSGVQISKGPSLPSVEEELGDDLGQEPGWTIRRG